MGHLPPLGRVGMSVSWADRLTDRVAHGPVPSIVVWLGVSVVVYLVQLGALWVAEGSAGTLFRPAPAAVALVTGGWLWLIERFNASARRAMAGIRGTLRDPEQAGRLEARLVGSPDRPTVVLGLIAALVTVERLVTEPRDLESLGAPVAPLTLLVFGAVLAVLAFVGAAFVLKIVHLSWRIHRMLSQDVTVSCFEVAPLYAFSRLTAATSTTVIGSSVIVFASAPQTLDDEWGLILALGSLVVAALAFVLPLAGAHRRLLDEKARLQGATALRLRDAAASLHRALAEDDVTRMDPLQKALAGLEVESRMLARIPTWPWDPRRCIG